MTPYTDSFRQLLRKDLAEIRQAILAHESYEELVSSQDRELETEAEMLNLRREQVQMEKIIWMRDLARTLEKFQLYASARQKREYAKLVQCEDVLL